jgi:hypothetical protein
MYIVFGRKIMDTKEIGDLIQANSKFKVLKDMSKGSKREDIAAYNLSIDAADLSQFMEEEGNIDRESLKQLSEDEIFDEYLAAAEEYAAIIEDILPPQSIFDVMAYKWDKSDNEIRLIMGAAHEEMKELKLRDVMKKLMRQVE